MTKNTLKGLEKQGIVVKQVLALLLSCLVVFSVLPIFLGLLSAQTGQGEGEISVVLAPLLDKYGYPAVNADGTFYPNDRFEIAYNAELAREAVFEHVEVSYDSLVFNMFNSSSGFGSESGFCCFEVLPSASAGLYTFHFNAYGNRFSEPENITISVAVETAVMVQVVEYDPHFTVALAYTVPVGSGSSYDHPFAVVVRYDGNGPAFNLDQRAIIDNYTWMGYAQKLPEMDSLQQQALTPNLTVSSFISQTSNTQFQTQGLTPTITNQQTLTVDQTNFKNSDLPTTFLWETNTNHTYAWTQTLPITTALDGVVLEWFEWQASLTFPPQINPTLTNQTLSQEDLQNMLIDQFNTSNGTLTATSFGNTVTAIYAHNKNIDLIAKDAGVSKEETLNYLLDEPVYFTAQKQYAKLQYQLNPTVTKEITNQNFTNNLAYNLMIGCDLFGTPQYFEANFTCEYEFFTKPFNATAYKWNPTLQNWTIDNTINIETTFESALNLTTTDILCSNLEEQTTDQTALQIALKDLYDSGPQTFTGTGTLTANLKRTSPIYYNLNIQAGNQQKIQLQKTIQINFQTSNPYNLPLNFDPNSPLQATVLSDSSQNTILQIDAPTELGGLTNLTIYLVTNLPNENWNTLTKEQLNLKPLKTLELTLPQEQVQMPHEHEQIYQYYSGYSAVFEDILGFYGQTQIPLQKDKTTTALTSSGEALLYVEATNVWGTTFHQIIPIQPYTTPKWNIPLNQATTYLITIVVIAIIISIITYLIKNTQN